METMAKRKLRGANYISSKPGTSGVVWNQDCNTLLRTTGGGMPFGGKIEVWGSSSSWIGIMSDFVLFNVYEACKICNETSASTWCNTRAKMDLIFPEVATYIKFQFLSLFWGDYRWSIKLYTIPMLLCFNMTDRVICPKYQSFWELNKSGFVPYLLGPSMRLGSWAVVVLQAQAHLDPHPSLPNHRSHKPHWSWLQPLVIFWFA